jgi:hypothetical protein
VVKSDWILQIGWKSSQVFPGNFKLEWHTRFLKIHSSISWTVSIDCVPHMVVLIVTQSFYVTAEFIEKTNIMNCKFASHLCLFFIVYHVNVTFEEETWFRQIRVIVSFKNLWRTDDARGIRNEKIFVKIRTMAFRWCLIIFAQKIKWFSKEKTTKESSRLTLARRWSHQIK